MLCNVKCLKHLIKLNIEHRPRAKKCQFKSWSNFVKFYIGWVPCLCRLDGDDFKF